MGEPDPNREAFQELAWRDFIVFAWNEPDARGAFEAATGHKMLPAPKTELDRMIDDATGATDSYVDAFVRWMTVHQWGIDEAPATVRAALSKAEATEDG